MKNKQKYSEEIKQLHKAIRKKEKEIENLKIQAGLLELKQMRRR